MYIIKWKWTIIRSLFKSAFNDVSLRNDNDHSEPEIRHSTYIIKEKINLEFGLIWTINEMFLRRIKSSFDFFFCCNVETCKFDH